MERYREHTGQLEIIAGSMFAGKTEALIHRLRRAQLARLKTQTFKPHIDDRYSKEHIVSHSQMRLEAQIVSCAAEIPPLVDADTEVVGIDEAHFFDLSLVEACARLANAGKRVIVAGLDQDYLGRPFEQVAQLLAIAEYVTKLQAVCMKCGNPANFSQRLIADETRILVGAVEMYEARCRRCFVPEAVQATSELGQAVAQGS